MYLYKSVTQQIGAFRCELCYILYKIKIQRPTITFKFASHKKAALTHM